MIFTKFRIWSYNVITLPSNHNKIMLLQKGHTKPPKKCSVIIDQKLHDKLRHLAYQNRVSQKEIIKRAVAFYEKASIFDNLVK